MYLKKFLAELEHCLTLAGQLLGGPARAVRLDWDARFWLWPRLIREERQGLGPTAAFECFNSGQQGRNLEIGLERYRWDVPDGPLRLVHVSLPVRSPVGDFLAVAPADYRRFYRHLRRGLRDAARAEPPIMPADDRRRLWNNTVGFLRYGQEEMARYGVQPKRGVLLLGEPGNGKTMACRWLAAECRRRGLAWNSVTVNDYESARADGNVASLFRLERAGIVLFDDFDTALRTHDWQESSTRSTFLTELDGVDEKTGIVFLFTSNALPAELDPAMCRPGRIDVMISFNRPDCLLRRRFIEERWHEEVRAGIDVETVAGETDGFSFAELEEAKKLLVLRKLDTGSWDWPWVRASLRVPPAGRSRRPIGFRPASDPARDASHTSTLAGMARP